MDAPSSIRPRPLAVDRPASVWLASYPKSGSTWLRFLLHNLVVGAPANSGDIDRLLPSIHGEHGLSPDQLAHGGVVLTHKRYDLHHARYAVAGGFVCLVRHPADVVASNAHYFVLTGLDDFLRSRGLTYDQVTDGHINALVNAYLKHLLEHGASPKHRKLGMGSWGEHADSWLGARSTVPSVVLRYEDLRARPVVEIQRLLRFLGLVLSPDRIHAAIDQCSLASMKAMQEREIQQRQTGRFYDARHEAAYRMGLRFVNRGQVGTGARVFPPEALQRIATLWGGSMARLGYRMDGGEKLVDPRPAGLDEVCPLADGVGAQLFAR